MAGGLSLPAWETDRYAIQRELGCRVYLMGEEGSWNWREGLERRLEIICLHGAGNWEWVGLVS